MNELIDFIKDEQLGDFKENVSFKTLTTYKTGGNARIVVFPKSVSALTSLLDYLKDHQVPCGFTEENTKYFNYRDERVDAIHAITHNDDHPAGDCSHVIDKSIYQIMCFVDENEEKEILSHMPHCISARWHPTFCDISPIGGTKQLGIDKFLEYYGLDLKDTMAFGDGGNDMQMLQHVSLAVAMGNAGDELKIIADFVTKDVDDEGIAYALKHYGLIDL